MTTQTHRHDEPALPKQPAPRTRLGLLTVLAMICSVGAIGWCVWSVRDVLKPAERPKLAHQLAFTPPVSRESVQPAASGKPRVEPRAALPTSDASFTPVADAEDAKRQAAEAARRFGELASKMDGLSAAPIQTGDQIGASVDAFLTPLITDAASDRAAFLRANGGRADQADAVARMLGGIGRVLNLCSFDLSKAAVQRTGPLPKAVAAQLKQFTPGAAAFSMSESGGPDGNICSLTIPLATILPGANAEVADDATQIELLVPAKLKDASFADKPLKLGIVLWKGPGKTWVPQFLSFHTTDTATVRAIRDAIAPPTSGSRTAPANPSGGG